MCTKRDTRCATAARRTFSSPRRITASLPRAKWTTASQPSIARSDRKSTRLNSSHDQISYAVFCLKKKKRKGIFRSHDDTIHLNNSYDNTSNIVYCFTRSTEHTESPSLCVDLFASQVHQGRRSRGL